MTSQSRTDLQSDIDTKVASGTVAGVSAQDVREVVTNLNDSTLNLTDNDSDDITEGTTNLYNKVPAGGLEGETLAKASDDDYDLEWITGGSGANIITRLFNQEVSNTTTKTDWITITIPAGAMGTTGVLEVVVDGYIRNQAGVTANALFEILYGTGVIFNNTSANFSTDVSDDYAFQLRLRIANLGSATAQYMGGQFAINLNQDGVIGRGEIDSDEILVHGIIGSKADDIVENTANELDLVFKVQPSVAHANFKWVGKIVTAEIK